MRQRALDAAHRLMQDAARLLELTEAGKVPSPERVSAVLDPLRFYLDSEAVMDAARPKGKK